MYAFCLYTFLAILLPDNQIYRILKALLSPEVLNIYCYIKLFGT